MAIVRKFYALSSDTILKGHRLFTQGQCSKKDGDSALKDSADRKNEAALK